LPINPVLVLGQNAGAFASDGSKVVSFDLNSGLANWTYQAPAQTTISIIAATDIGGVAIKNSQQGIFELDATASAVQITADNTLSQVGYSWAGTWNAFSGLNSGGILLPLAADFANLWATPAGTPSQTNSSDALCDCLVETTEPAPPPPPLTCPICDLQAPTQAPTCTSTAGSLSTYLILVGDSSTDPNGGHNVGNLFNLSAQTKANDLQAQGHPVVACRVSTVQHVNQALTLTGLTFDGGVVYFGHAGWLYDGNDNRIYYSLLAVGQQIGDNWRISYVNVGTLSNAQLGPNATITLNACHAGLQTSSGKPAIARLIANQLRRNVDAYEVGMYFSQDPNDTHFNGRGLPNPPNSLPMYMIPEGGVPKPKPTPFRPK